VSVNKSYKARQRLTLFISILTDEKYLREIKMPTLHRVVLLCPKPYNYDIRNNESLFYLSEFASLSMNIGASESDNIRLLSIELMLTSV